MIPLFVIGLLAQSQTSRISNGMYRFTSNIEVCDSVISRNNTFPQVHCMNGDVPTIGCRRFDSGCEIGQRIATDVHVPSYMYNYTNCNHYLWMWRCAYDWRICAGDQVCVCDIPIINPNAALHLCNCSSNNKYDMIGCPIRTYSPTTSPTALPSTFPTSKPTLTPTLMPTDLPTTFSTTGNPTVMPTDSPAKPVTDSSIKNNESSGVTVLVILLLAIVIVGSGIICYVLYQNIINKRKIKKLESTNSGIVNPVFDSGQEDYAVAKESYLDGDVEQQYDTHSQELYESVNDRDTVPVIYHGVSPSPFDYMNQDPNDEILATYDVVDNDNDDAIVENDYGGDINVPVEDNYGVNNNVRFNESAGEYSDI